MTGKLVYVTPQEQTQTGGETGNTGNSASPELGADFANEDLNHSDVAETTIQGVTDKLPFPWCGILTRGDQSMSRLPNGISVVNITQLEGGQPLRIILPSVGLDQYWCMVNVNTLENTVNCPESGVTLETKTLKGAADLAQQAQTTIETITTDQLKENKYSIYCAPYLGSRVFVGPFAAGTEGKPHTAGNDNKHAGLRRTDKRNKGMASMHKRRRNGRVYSNFKGKARV